MERVKTSTAVAVLPAATDAGGTAGYFYEGDPSASPPVLATMPGPDWFNRTQEEIAKAIELAGITLDGADNTQLYQAITTLVASASKSVKVSNAGFEATVVNSDAVRWDSVNNRFAKAIADGTANGHVVGFADVTNSEVVSFGETRSGLLSGLVPGARYYLDAVTPGALTTTVPADIVNVGIAKAADILFVDVDAGTAAAIPSVNPIVQRRIKYLGNTSNSGAVSNFTVPNWNDIITLTSAGNYLHAKVHSGTVYLPPTGNDHISIGVSVDGINFKTTGLAGYEAVGHDYRQTGQEGGSTIIGEMVWQPGTVGPHTIYALLYSNSGQQGSPTFSWSNCYIELMELDASLITITAL